LNGCAGDDSSTVLPVTLHGHSSCPSTGIPGSFVGGCEPAEISRLSRKILTLERKYRCKAALCANLSTQKLIARQIRQTRLVDKIAFHL
jgi:hypothetical protein